MKTQIPLNPKVLQWARLTSGYELSEIAKKMKKSVEDIENWESGASSPTYVQLEKLAYELYKRPIALFFFPEIPFEDPSEKSFRALPYEEFKKIHPHLKYIFRKAKSKQINLYELFEGVNPAEKIILNDIEKKRDVQIYELVKKVRIYLSVDMKTQYSWKNNKEAFSEWRAVLENCGIFIFKEAFKDNYYSGFCLYDKIFPIIYINNSMPLSRQIFTLFHELAHLFLGFSGIETRTINISDNLEGEYKDIEIICNKFAGEFLVPNSEFIPMIRKSKISDGYILSLSKTFNVSREVILRKLLDNNRVDKIFYNQMLNEWNKTVDLHKKSGGNYYFTQKAYISNMYLEKAFSNFYQHKINQKQLANYLGIKVKAIPGIESLIYKNKVSK